MEKQMFGSCCLWLVVIFMMIVAGSCQGCSVISSPSFCESVSEIFSMLGKSICQSMNESPQSPASLLKIPSEFHSVIIRSDTLTYILNRTESGEICIKWRSTNGFSGSLMLDPVMVLKE